jgi:hypothetical protein
MTELQVWQPDEFLLYDDSTKVVQEVFSRFWFRIPEYQRPAPILVGCIRDGTDHTAGI